MDLMSPLPVDSDVLSGILSRAAQAGFDPDKVKEIEHMLLTKEINQGLRQQVCLDNYLIVRRETLRLCYIEIIKSMRLPKTYAFS